MKHRKILFVDTAHPILKTELERDGYQCDSFPAYRRDDYIKVIKDYFGAIVRSKLKFDRGFLDEAKNLKFIARVGAGMENIDVDYANENGIACINAPEGNRDAVGEQAIGMLLSLMNNLQIADEEVRKGIWERELNRGVELGGKTIGIIGYGNTGGAFARKLSGFDVELLAYDKYKFDYSDDFVKESKMQDLYDQCDILSLHIPLTDETNYLVDDVYISRFKKPIYLINTSRGAVVNTNDLVTNLENGKVLGACLDVLEYEGLSFEHLAADQLPEEFNKLVKMQHVILTPHIAGWTHESNYKLAMTIVEKVRRLDL